MLCPFCDKPMDEQAKRTHYGCHHCGYGVYMVIGEYTNRWTRMSGKVVVMSRPAHLAVTNRHIVAETRLFVY